MDKDTVSNYFVSAAVARLADAQRARVLVAAGIPGELLAAPHARVPAESFAALWLAVAAEIDDEFFGLDRRRMKVGSFALLCHAALHGERLERALRQVLRGFATMLDDIDAELGVDGPYAVITLHNRIEDPAARRFADETLLVMVHGLMCWLAGKRIALSTAEFSGARPAHALEYAVMFTEHLRFDAAATRVRFDARLLAGPIVQNAATLKTFLRTAPQSVFLRYKNEDSWTARLRRRLRDNIGANAWPLLDDIANEFHVTPTTMRRRLVAEGTSYQTIKDELRRDAAIHHLCHSAQRIADIGSLLGYQDASAFHRAFKKWSGVQPGEYRSRSGVPQQPVAVASKT